MEFQGQQYTLNQAEVDLWQFISESKPREYTRYYDKFVFNTGRGFIAAYVDDLDNYWNI